MKLLLKYSSIINEIKSICFRTVIKKLPHIVSLSSTPFSTLKLTTFLQGNNDQIY